MTDKQIKILLILIPALLAAMLAFDKYDPAWLSFLKKAKATPVNIPIKTSSDREEQVKKLAAIYLSEVGVRELTGNNDGKRVEEYLAQTGHKAGAAWCAAFVSWCHNQAGIKAANSAWSPAWFPDNKTIYTHGFIKNTTPCRADVFGQYFPQKRRIAHVGFIDDWDDDTSYCITVEGNTNDGGSREGDGVYRKRRLKNQIYKVSRWI